MESPIIRFYRNAGTDHAGRRLDQILAWHDGTLEAVHDYIQWLFPLDEPSAFNPDAPLLSKLDCEGSGAAIARAEDWPARSRRWMRPGNHNYLRLTRIMKSLTILGQPALARALGERLASEYRQAPDLIGATALGYWRTASGVDSQKLQV